MSGWPRGSMRTVAEQGDLVFYFGSEWTVHEVKDGIALLRKHDDPELTDTNFKVSVTAIGAPFRKAADR